MKVGDRVVPKGFQGPEGEIVAIEFDPFVELLVYWGTTPGGRPSDPSVPTIVRCSPDAVEAAPCQPQ